jgi:hypothetical protein
LRSLGIGERWLSLECPLSRTHSRKEPKC